MSIFNSKSDKGVSGNSGNASGGNWTLSGAVNGHRKVKSMRMEWKAPRSGDLSVGQSARRPNPKKGGRRS